MWCLLLAVLHEEGRQSTLRHLAEKIVSLAATMPEIGEQGIQFDLKTAATRRGLVCVIRMAISYSIPHNRARLAETLSDDGVIHRTRGDYCRAVDIAQSLHKNIQSAHRLYRLMNEEVESRPMCTGMRLRFRWHPKLDESDQLRSACRTLLKQPAAMSPGEQSSLGEFLQNQIAEARRRDDAGTWVEHLTEALDYRTWFAFDIERETHGKWERLTKRTHGTGSGGERAVSLIMPMLAALAVYYSSADLLGRPAMRPLIERLDRRLGQNPDLSGTLTIANCSDEDIDAITGLLCKPPLKSGSLTVRLSDLDDAAVNAVGVNLVIAISELLGIQCDCAESVLWKK